MVETQCKYCYKSFVYFPCYPRKFCSIDCSLKYRKYNNPIKRCVQCNNTFIQAVPNKRFCSLKCKKIWRSIHKRKIRLKDNCIECGKEFIKEVHNKKFCSNLCAKRHYRKNNLEKLRKQDRELYRKNPERCREYTKKWYRNNLEVARKLARDHYKRNRVKIAENKKRFNSKLRKDGKCCLICNKRLNITQNYFCSTQCTGKRENNNFKDLKRHPNYHGGISYEPYGQEFNKKLKAKIRKRDNYKCQECGIAQKDIRFLKKKRRLDIHHLDYQKNNNSESNLISLCYKCHLNTNYKRDFWEKKYKIKMRKIYKL